jgi:hypothetical protein
MRDDEPPALDRPPSKLASLRTAFREFAFGMTGYEFARHAVETRAALENVFLLVLVGDLIGVPVMPPYYSLGLLPYVVPDVATWKRRVLREREFTDKHEYHLHGA